MSRFKTKEALLEDIAKERKLFEELLAEIPTKHKTKEVVDGMSVKDFLAHRTEWGKMMLTWYETAKRGKVPAVPTEEYKWNQLKELNAAIHKKYKNVSLKKIEAEFKTVHDKLFKIIKSVPEKDLLTKNVFNFTGVSDIATYFNSATASHYRSARRHIQKWWKVERQ